MRGKEMNAAGQSRERWAFWAKAQFSAFCGVLRGVASLLAEKWWKVLLTAAILVVLAPAAVHYTAWALRRLVLTAKVVCAWWIAQIGSVQGVSELLWPYQYVAILMLVCVLAWGVYRTISSWLPERWKGLDGSGCQQGLSQPDQAWKPGSPDRLTRGDFVRVLKLLIRNAPRSEGAQYIGLYGTWGDGKTSVINMLKDRSRAWPFVFVDFSPWDRAGSLSYAAALFDAIAAQMPFRLVDPIRRLLRRFGRLVSVKGERRLGGWAIEFVVDVFGWIAGSALDVKKQLVERLDKIGRRIVVIIDDVDRLPPKDVYELIRVIKANGDLPNVTYLLAADKTYLATALATVLQFPGDAVEEGRRYLEKIIQVECPLPSNDRADIEQELLERAREVPRRYIHGVAELKDGDIADVVPLVKNLRQVSRVLNVFEVDVAMQSRKHGMRSSMDVHLGDLLALSVLKVYCPDFVSRLHSAFDSWVYQSTHGQSDAAGRSSDWVNMTLIGDVPVELRNVLLTVLEKRLRMKNRKGGQKGDEERFVLEDSASSEGLRDFRLFSRFAFENYFSSKKNQVPVRRKAYRQFVARLETAPLDGKFLADVVRNRFLYPILHMLEAEPIRHSRRWNENLVASLACVADLDLSNACKRGDSAFIADTDAYSAVFDAVRGFVRRWDCSEELSKDVLSVGLKKANSFQVRARFVSDNLWAFRNGRAEDNMLPEKDFQGHVDAILDLFARKGRVLEAYSNEAFLRTVWCRIVKELGDPTRDAEFGSAFDPSRVSDGEMQSLLELFLVHDAREFRVAAFDLERAERLFDIGTVRSRLLNYEPANALLDYIDFAIQMKAAGRKADVASQLEVLRGVPEFSPVLASSRIRPGSGK